MYPHLSATACNEELQSALFQNSEEDDVPDLDRVLALVEQSETQRDRMVAAALMQIAQALTSVREASESNTKANEEIAKALKGFREEYVADRDHAHEQVARGQGAYKVAAIVASFVSALALLFGSWVAADYWSHGQRLALLEARISRAISDIQDQDRDTRELRNELKVFSQRLPGGSRGP